MCSGEVVPEFAQQVEREMVKARVAPTGEHTDAWYEVVFEPEFVPAEISQPSYNGVVAVHMLVGVGSQHAPLGWLTVLCDPWCGDAAAVRCCGYVTGPLPLACRTYPDGGQVEWINGQAALSSGALFDWACDAVRRCIAVLGSQP